jgi:hypothetical protein
MIVMGTSLKSIRRYPQMNDQMVDIAAKDVIKKGCSFGAAFCVGV